MNSPALRLCVSALLGLCAVICGSLGAHGRVHDRLLASGELEHWQTAVDYNLPHAILAVVLALNVLADGKAARWAWRFIVAGMLLFCGSLYVLALTDMEWLRFVTPFGGVSLMAGWLLIALSRPARA